MKKSVLSVPAVLLLLALLLASTVAFAACADDSEEPSTTVPATETSTDATSPTDTTSSTDGSPEPGEQPGSETPKPGLYEQKDGTVQAVGVLTYRDLEGGFWAVVETSDAAKAEDADIIAVLGPSDQIPGPIGSYENKYVSVIGMPQSASVYQAGQFVELQSIKTLDAEAVK